MIGWNGMSASGGGVMMSVEVGACHFPSLATLLLAPEPPSREIHIRQETRRKHSERRQNTRWRMK